MNHPERQVIPQGAESVLRVGTGETPSADVFWSWRDAISPLFDVAVRGPEDLSRFHVDLTALRHGGMLLVRFAMGPLILRRSPTSIARSFGADHFLVMVHAAPAAARDGSWNAAAGDITILDLSQPCHFVCEQLRCDMLIVPRRQVEPLLGDAEPVPIRQLRRGTPLARLLGGHVETLFDTAAALDAVQAEAMAPASLHLLAGCLACTGEAQAAPLAHRRHKSMLSRIRAFIEANLSSPDLSPAVILEHHALSRAMLYRLFEPYGGVADYVRRRRLAHCYADIASPAQRHRPISDIAYAHGFINETAFSRAFSDHFGISPRRTRHAARHGQSPVGDPAVFPLEAFRGWLLCL